MNENGKASLTAKTPRTPRKAGEALRRDTFLFNPRVARRSAISGSSNTPAKSASRQVPYLALLAPWRFVICFVAVSLFSAACSSPFDHAPLTQPQLTDDLQTIQPADLHDYVSDPPQPLPAEGDVHLSLEQLRAWVLEDNLELHAQLIAPAIAEQDLTAQEARFEAVLFGRGSYSDNETPTATVLEGSETQNTNGQLGVRLPLRTGGTLTAEFAGSRNDTNNTFSTLNPSFGAGPSVSLSQPLLRNAGHRVTEAPIQIARLDAQAVNARTRLQVIRILTETDRAYWQLYDARQQLQVRRQQHELATAQLQRAQRLVDAGNAAEVEILRAQAGVADGLEAIISAENQLRQTQRRLKRFANQPQLPPNGSAVLVPATDPNPVAYQLNLAPLIDAARQQRVELLETELTLARDALNIDLARNATLPLAVLDYRYGRNGLGASFGDAVDQTFEQDFDSHRVGLNVEIPLGNQAARARLQSALLTRLQRLATREQQEAQINQEIADALDTLETTWQTLLAARQSVLLEARVLGAEQRQFDLGLVTSTDVLDAQTRLANARSREASALATYQIAQTDLAFATGTVLGQAQIRWAPVEITQQ